MFAELLRREQQPQRFGSGNQDVRRLAHHLGAVGERSVAATHRHLHRRELPAPLGSQRLHLRQRLLQVAVDVVRQRLERRDVERLYPILQLTDGSTAEQVVQDAQEGGECLARAGGRGDQDVLPGVNQRHRHRLRWRQVGEAAAEPFADERFEIGQHFGLAFPFLYVLYHGSGNIIRRGSSEGCNRLPAEPKPNYRRTVAPPGHRGLGV